MTMFFLCEMFGVFFSPYAALVITSRPVHVRFFVALYCFFPSVWSCSVFPFVSRSAFIWAVFIFCRWICTLFLVVGIVLAAPFFSRFVNKQIYWIKLQIIAVFPHSSVRSLLPSYPFAAEQQQNVYKTELIKEKRRIAVKKCSRSAFVAWPMNNFLLFAVGIRIKSETAWKSIIECERNGEYQSRHQVCVRMKRVQRWDQALNWTESFAMVYIHDTNSWLIWNVDTWKCG